MPMWMSCLNLQTDKTERIYNYHDPDTPEGHGHRHGDPLSVAEVPGFP